VTFRIAGYRFRVEDVLAVGYVLGVAAMALLESDAPERGNGGAYRGRNAQSVTLHEDDLRRLEDGDTLRTPRWHGHELELSADLVVNASELPESEPENDQTDE
jgi:hypothetical protein